MKTEEVNASHYEANIAGVPRVLAHLNGGQGPINVPSLSPDSRQLAFVSNSEEAKKVFL